MGVIWDHLGIMLESLQPIWGQHVLKNDCNMFYLCHHHPRIDKISSHCGSRLFLGAISSSRWLYYDASAPKLQWHLVAHIAHRRRHHHRKHRLKQLHENQRLEAAPRVQEAVFV